MKKFGIGWNKLVFSFLILFSTQILAADAFRLFEPQRYDFDLGIDYGKTNSNFSSNGSRESLPTDNSFSALNVGVSGRYVLNSQIGLLSGLQLTNTESSDASFIRKNSALSYFHAGMDYLFLKEDNYSLFTELVLSYPFEKMNSNTDSVLNSDGAIELKPQVTAVLLKNGYSPYGSLGLNYRTEGLSTLITYIAGVELEFTRFGFGGNINGYFTLLGDQKSEAERNAINNRVNGGSFKFNSYYPSVFATDLYMKFYLNKDFIMKAHLGFPLIGYNTAAGLNLGFSMSWGFGGGAVYSKPQPPPQISQPEEAPVISQPIGPTKSKPSQPLLTKPAVQSTQLPSQIPPHSSVPPTSPQSAPHSVPQPTYKPLLKPPQPPKPKPIPVPPVVQVPKSKPKPKNSDTSYIKQIEGSPKSLEKATEPDEPVSNTIKEPAADYTIKLKKIKKSKKKK